MTQWKALLALMGAAQLCMPNLVAAQGAAIDEDTYINIDGIEQWITIRGTDRSNPVILFLHGGPGSSLSPFADQLFGSWKQYFTLVQWDQPGAGKTFGSTGESIAAELSLSRIVEDGLTVSEYVRRHLEKEKIILLGGSWGSIVGVHMAQERPDLFHAYVGTPQVVDLRAAFAETYELLRERIDMNADGEALEQLEAIGPPPWEDIGSLGAFWRLALRYEAENSVPSRSPMDLFSPDYSQEDIALRFAGDMFSQVHFFGENLDGELMRVDVAESVDGIPIPLFIIQGAEDMVSPPAHAEAFLRGISAPHKEFVLLQNVGHDTFTQAPDALLEEILKRVLPIVTD